MERTRPTTVVVDGVAVGQEFSISAPQRYDLTTQLTPGEHTLEIIVDNGESIPAAVRNSSHACTESTQTNWNGIIGDFHILATDPMHLENVKIIPDIDNREFKISGDFTGDKNHGAKVTVKSGNNSASTVIKPNAPQHFEIILPAYDTPLSERMGPATLRHHHLPRRQIRKHQRLPGQSNRDFANSQPTAPISPSMATSPSFAASTTPAYGL